MNVYYKIHIHMKTFRFEQRIVVHVIFLWVTREFAAMNYVVYTSTFSKKHGWYLSELI